jgi:hypothetical protein
MPQISRTNQDQVLVYQVWKRVLKFAAPDSLQYRRNEPNRRRRIKRDVLSNIQNWKGIAGLRPPSSRTQNSSPTDSPTTQDAVATDALTTQAASTTARAASGTVADASTSSVVDQVSKLNIFLLLDWR